MPQIERQNPAAVPLGARNHRSIGKAERQIGITLDQSANARKVSFATVQAIPTVFEVAEKRRERLRRQPPLDHEGHFGQNPSGNEIGSTVGA